jgi:hypothetical protein
MIAPRNSRRKAKDEVKHRSAGETQLSARLGSADVSTPIWYDEIPKVKYKVLTWSRPWTMAGTKEQPALPMLVGLINDKGNVSKFGHIIRVSQAFKDWNHQASDFIYFDRLL